MRLNKDNCSIIPSRFDNTAELLITASHAAFANAKVIEVPKVWREYGTQYKVTKVRIDAGLPRVCWNASTDWSCEKFKYMSFKVPRSCVVSIVQSSSTSSPRKIEYYD